MFPRILAQLSLVALIATNLCAETTPAPSPSPRAPARPTTITATFWNIQWFPGRRPNPSHSEENRQIRAVHRDFAQLDPDIIGLEEVRDWHQAEVGVQPLDKFKVDVCSNFPPREG